MSTRSISATAVAGSLKMVRVPLDLAVALIPVGRRPLRLAVDRADANVRSLAATLLGDDGLREDAYRRHAAAEARQRADDLRSQAAQTAERTGEKVEERHREAARRREGAASQARSRREQAANRQARRSERAAQTERQRRQSSRKVQNAVEETIEDQAPRARLEALDDVAQAQRERDQALTEMNEAERLREAAERVKAERKRS